MTTTTNTNTRVELEHPYWGAGLIAVIASFAVLGFSLGVLSRCGGGRGLCFDYATHASGDAGLILFVFLLIVGVGLIAYTGSARAFTTSTRVRDPPAAPAVVNVVPAAPQPSVTNVFPSPAVNPPAATVVVAGRP
jgi:hypothetical protein